MEELDFILRNLRTNLTPVTILVVRLRRANACPIEVFETHIQLLETVKELEDVRDQLVDNVYENADKIEHYLSEIERLTGLMSLLMEPYA